LLKVPFNINQSINLIKPTLVLRVNFIWWNHFCSLNASFCYFFPLLSKHEIQCTMWKHMQQERLLETIKTMNIYFNEHLTTHLSSFL
jgi:hypothetical protein